MCVCHCLLCLICLRLDTLVDLCVKENKQDSRNPFVGPYFTHAPCPGSLFMATPHFWLDRFVIKEFVTFLANKCLFLKKATLQKRGQNQIDPSKCIVEIHQHKFMSTRVNTSRWFFESHPEKRISNQFDASQSIHYCVARSPQGSKTQSRVCQNRNSWAYNFIERQALYRSDWVRNPPPPAPTP